VVNNLHALISMMFFYTVSYYWYHLDFLQISHESKLFLLRQKAQIQKPSSATNHRAAERRAKQSKNDLGFHPYRNGRSC